MFRREYRKLEMVDWGGEFSGRGTPIYTTGFRTFALATSFFDSDHGPQNVPPGLPFIYCSSGSDLLLCPVVGLCPLPFVPIVSSLGRPTT